MVCYPTKNPTFSPRQIMGSFRCLTMCAWWFIGLSSHFCQHYMKYAPDKLPVISAGRKAISSEHVKCRWSGSIRTLPWQSPLCLPAATQLEYRVMYCIWMLHFIIKPSTREYHWSLHIYVCHRCRGKCAICGAWHAAGMPGPTFLRGADFRPNTEYWRSVIHV